MKKVLLAAAATLAHATSADAAGWYFAADVGASWAQDNSYVFGEAFTVPVTFITGPHPANHDTGWSISGSVGWASAGGWRFEGEVGYRTNELSLPHFTRSGDVGQFTVMANVLYDIPVASSLSLSLGGGLGAGIVTISHNVLEEDQSMFAWQLIGGLNWSVSADTELTLTYRYLDAGAPDITGPHGVHFDREKYSDLSDHSLSVGLRFSLGE